MDLELFRFITVRPADAVSPAENQIEFRVDGAGGKLLEQIRHHSALNDRSELDSAIRNALGSDQLLTKLTNFETKLITYRDVLLRVGGTGALSELAPALLTRLFDRDAPALKTDPDLAAARARTANTVVAGAISNRIGAAARATASALAAAIGVIDALAAGRTLGAVADTLIILPGNTFPLPPSGRDLGPDRQARRDRLAKSRSTRSATLLARSKEVRASRAAITDVLDVLAARPSALAPSETRGIHLSNDEADQLSAETKALLDGLGGATRIDVAGLIARLDRRAKAAAAAIYASPPVQRLVKIGDVSLPLDVLETLEVDSDPANAARHPGPCPAVMLDPAPAGVEPTIPFGHGDVKVLGIADLMVVEQQLARYELNEISHIENVLKSEKRERRLRTSVETEQSQLSEVENTDERQNDLASTERYELQVEAQNSINENSGREAGLTITASYGPSVDATATANFANSSSKQQSDQSSSTYARDVTASATARVQKRTLERRLWRQVTKTVETNVHAFDNSGPAASDISGIYRFVEKVYSAQVINYGKRLMLEFIVPEPAAFYRHALTRQPVDGTIPAEPDTPGYCLDDAKTFVRLQPSDITPDNYMYWAGKYGAEDITPPPAPVRIASVAKKSPEQMQKTQSDNDDSPLISSDAFEVEVPDGYQVVTAMVNLYGNTQAGDHHLMVQVQEQQFKYAEPTDDGLSLTLRVAAAAKIGISINSLRFYNYELLATILCRLSQDAYEAWQLKTYASVMASFDSLKSRYDSAVQAARVLASYAQTSGSSPFENRAIEQTELKRGCISMMSGQRFDSFDAVPRAVAPFGYPEIDFIEAKAEAPFIRLFEQSIEWQNMTYLFYPYFWGRKDGWVTQVQLRDDDALFNRFLQAGAARVQVPVRLGFDRTILNYFAGAAVWDADGNIITGDDDGLDPVQLSIVTELKTQFGNNDVDGPGTLTLVQGSALVVGEATRFTQDDVRRRLIIGSSTYIIKSVTDETHIELTAPVAETNTSDAGYALGGRLVGQPWEIRLPTNLVKLDDYAF